MVCGRIHGIIPGEKCQQKDVSEDFYSSGGFPQNHPITGCYFGNYEFYNGVEFDMNYRFPNNRLDDYEDRVSTGLNKCLRHHAGVDMTNPKLGL